MISAVGVARAPVGCATVSPTSSVLRASVTRGIASTRTMGWCAPARGRAAVMASACAT